LKPIPMGLTEGGRSTRINYHAIQLESISEQDK
jgi:hypothetical protein